MLVQYSISRAQTGFGIQTTGRRCLLSEGMNEGKNERINKSAWTLLPFLTFLPSEHKTDKAPRLLEEAGHENSLIQQLSTTPAFKRIS